MDAFIIFLLSPSSVLALSRLLMKTFLITPNIPSILFLALANLFLGMGGSFFLFPSFSIPPAWKQSLFMQLERGCRNRIWLQ
jgi:hypothetical protein